MYAVDQRRAFQHFRLHTKQLCRLAIDRRNNTFNIEAELHIASSDGNLWRGDRNLHGLARHGNAPQNKTCRVKQQYRTRNERAARYSPAGFHREESKDRHGCKGACDGAAGLAACKPDFKRQARSHQPQRRIAVRESANCGKPRAIGCKIERTQNSRAQAHERQGTENHRHACKTASENSKIRQASGDARSRNSGTKQEGQGENRTDDAYRRRIGRCDPAPAKTVVKAGQPMQAVANDLRCFQMNDVQRVLLTLAIFLPMKADFEKQPSGWLQIADEALKKR